MTNYFPPERFAEFRIEQERLWLQGAYADMVGNACHILAQSDLPEDQCAIASRYAAEGYAGTGDFADALECGHDARDTYAAKLERGRDPETVQHYASTLVCLGSIGLRMAIAGQSNEHQQFQTVDAVRYGAKAYAELGQMLGGSHVYSEVRDRRRIALVESVLGSSVEGMLVAKVAREVTSRYQRNLLVATEADLPKEPPQTAAYKVSLVEKVARRALVSTNRLRSQFITRNAPNAL
jgi:hypothetical protein